MSLWIYTPEIVENKTGKVVFRFEDPHWSADYSTWLGPTKVRLGLRKYPGDKLPDGIIVDIDVSDRVAFVENQPVSLDELEAILDRRLNST